MILKVFICIAGWLHPNSKRLQKALLFALPRLFQAQQDA